ncbi:dihydroneopterin aldolase [Helicovermis profundi]|uniref:7,8-dihydroneopterin aldolase n=1 Tax=Helicovermis profundi TaxID=3065157 RepID=A0AAU9EAF0_9FIRM|nr:dihydroneopterin aldolase [Clostridia bacterium S502]
MDKIIMHNMYFYGYHGVLEAEKTIGQKFIVDVEIMLDLESAGKSDSVENTISYADVYDDIKYLVESERFNLIEALSERIASNILSRYSLAKEVLVRLKKPEAPVKGIFDYFAVEIRRKK